MSITLVNCDVYESTSVIPDAAVTLLGSSIASVGSLGDASVEGEVIDLGGLNVAPGFIDLQVNGGGDVLFNDNPTASGIETIVKAHAQYGTTSLLPTYITGPDEGMVRARDAVTKYMQRGSSAVLGIHYEGPSISPLKLGVHDGRFARGNFPVSLLERVGGVPIVLVTIAPEAGDLDLVPSLVNAGAYVAVGHSNADYEVVRQALDDGASLATHLYNAMSPLTGREPGVVGAFLEDREACVDLIVDGYHCHFASVAVAYRAKRPGKCFLVTDAMPPVGGSAGGYALGPLSITVENGKCVTEDGTLAGSALDMATAVRHCVQRVGIPMDEALRMASLYPAQYLGVDDRLGRIRPGYVANLVVFDNQIRVRGVFLDGGAYLNL